MKILVICALLLGCAYAEDDDEQQVQQFVKSVKGGHGSWQPYNPTSDDLVRIFQNSSGPGVAHNLRQNLTGGMPDLDVGVCYIEVPTASLVRGGGQIPVGNGSQPHLSRIRGCCRGYIRNIHNFRKCDPVCTEECVNALCTAPDTCTCYPDHVKNLAGFCIPTCPIGCQNGHCSGGECLCKEGFKLDQDSRFCIPICKENCGGIGNCTAPNTCDCKQGYQTSPEGSCKPHCEKCSNGDCVAPNECRCHQGFAKNQQGLCIPQCDFGYHSTPEGCKPVCDRCTNGDCVGPNQCRCHQGYGRDQQGLCTPLCSPSCGPTSRCVSPNVCDPPVQPNQPNNLPPNQPYQPPYQPGNQPPNQPYQPPYQPGNQPPNQPYQPRYQPGQPIYPDNQNVVPEGVPQCALPCLNGACVGTNTCRCNQGYVPDNTDPNKCMPNCPGGCPNGVCSAPNFCICNVGYFKDHSVKGRPTCVKRAKRSVDSQPDMPKNIADLLIFEIPDY